MRSSTSDKYRYVGFQEVIDSSWIRGKPGSWRSIPISVCSRTECWTHDVSFAPFSNHNSVNCSPLRPGGSLVYIFVPWKPVVIVWALLSGMILAGFIGSSLLQGKDPFAPPTTVQKSTSMKASAAHTGQQPNHAHKASESGSR